MALFFLQGRADPSPTMGSFHIPRPPSTLMATTFTLTRTPSLTQPIPIHTCKKQKILRTSATKVAWIWITQRLSILPTQTLLTSSIPRLITPLLYPTTTVPHNTPRIPPLQSTFPPLHPTTTRLSITIRTTRRPISVTTKAQRIASGLRAEQHPALLTVRESVTAVTTTTITIILWAAAVVTKTTTAVHCQ